MAVRLSPNRSKYFKASAGLSGLLPLNAQGVLVTGSYSGSKGGGRRVAAEAAALLEAVSGACCAVPCPDGR